MSEKNDSYSPNSSYFLHGEIAPYIQQQTKNRKQIEQSPEAERSWDQQKGESAVAYSAFLLYLDLGAFDRSHKKLAKIIYGNEKSTGQISKWSVNHDWINRAEDWDRFCAETRMSKMEKAVHQAEDIMLSYLPKVTKNLCMSAAGEKTLGRAEMRAISDFMDRVGPAKQRRSLPAQFNADITVNVPALPGEVKEDTADIEDATVIEEQAANLIPKDLKNKRK